ncbi:MAG: GlxA family transcriptional regulator [Gammaproteobacteria bacterium]|jgi:transcriptional regulator GlxA family with amidase domain
MAIETKSVSSARGVNHHTVLVLFDQFPLIPFSCLIDCMRTANKYAGPDTYSWEIVSPDGRHVQSSSGVRIEVNGSLQGVGRCGRAILIATNQTQHFDDDRTFHKLTSLGRKGALLGSASSGSFVLARAGLLEDYRCTIHWENLPVFRELYPTLNITRNIYEIDRDRATCSGGTAALDMMLKLIEMDCGQDVARRISQMYQHDRLRTPEDQQRMEGRYDLIRLSPKLAEAIDLMQNNIEDPLSPQEVASHVGVSLRQLERLFKKYRGTTPQRYYLRLRLENARQLLLYTSHSGLDVAIASGFSSHSHFIKSYRDVYGRTPREERVVDQSEV